MGEADTARVLILGAGPVGLGAALELARFGVPSVLIEKHSSTSFHPKTRNFNTRTMEIARGWGEGVYRRLRSIDTPEGWKTPIRFLESATGRQFGMIDSTGFEGPGPDGSPALPIMSSQDLIEAIMLDAVYATGLVDVRFGTEATHLVAGGEDDAGHAAVMVRDHRGAEQLVSGVALVAADGAQSLIRRELDLTLEGPQGLQHIVNCYFKADIESRLGERRGVLLFVSNPRANGVLQALDGEGRWLCQITVKAEDWSLDVFDHDRARRWVRDAVGDPAIDVDVQSLGLWKLNATIVDRLVQGRVLMCGDAAHQFPPTGGLGVNTGLQGMHNAMWKLACFVKGQADWSLVASYDDERRAVAKTITEQSLENSINVARINAAAVSTDDSGLSTEDVVTASRRYGNHLGVEFGAHYVSSAVVADGRSPPAVTDSYSDFAPSATPGCRAPHVWLGRRPETLSTLDLIGADFTLFAAAGGSAWRDDAAAAATSAGVRLNCFVMGEGGLTDEGRLMTAYGIEEDGAVLVRPDGHVGWRARSRTSPGPSLAAALRQILHG